MIHERIAMHRWPGLSQDASDPQAQAEGHAIEALATVLRECWMRDYERQQPTLRNGAELCARQAGELLFELWSRWEALQSLGALPDRVGPPTPRSMA